MSQSNELTRRKAGNAHQALLAGCVHPAASSDALALAFSMAYRGKIAAIMCQSPALADLATTFPALLFAIATGYGTPAARDDAIVAVCTGAPLREAARRLALPTWLKRVPAAALTGPLTALPDGPGLASRLTPVIPDDDTAAAAWLHRLSYAYRAVDLDFALWVAECYRSHLPDAGSEMFLWLTAWGWYSTHPSSTAHALLRKPWQPSLGTRRAQDELIAWQRRIELHVALARKPEADWLAEGEALGYSFVRLRSASDFIGESRIMDNCLDQYADQLQRGQRQIYSIRHNDEPVADVEISHHAEDRTIPAIIQLRMRGNRRAPPQVWQATYAWLGSERLRPISATRRATRLTTIQRAAWFDLWRPYLEWLEARGVASGFADLVGSRPGITLDLGRRNDGRTPPRGS